MSGSHSSQRDSLSSSEITRNLKNIKKERYIPQKIAALLILLLLLWLVYFVIKNDGLKGPDIPIVNTVDTVEAADTAGVSELPQKDNIKEVEKEEKIDEVVRIKKINIEASSLDLLRTKLLKESFRLMSSGDYTPVNPRLNISKNKFSCELKKQPSGFIKLSLVWGPISNCESCLNSIQRNPGSIALINTDDGSFEYQVTAISK